MSKNYVTKFRGETYFTPNGKINIKDEPPTPIEDDFGDHNLLDNSFENECGYFRRSLSMSDLAVIKREGEEHSVQGCRRPTISSQDLSKSKYVSVAEAIYHYQKDTPKRFHSKRSPLHQSSEICGNSRLTVPQSPMLRTKTRFRPTYIISQKEKEEIELEELKKIKIKANPVPKYVIEGSKILPEVSKKPLTVPEPFHLTEMHKKSIASPNYVPAFKARPVPKYILEKNVVPTKPIDTKSVVAHLRLKGSISTENKAPKLAGPKVEKRKGPVRPEPFSFEKRNEELKRMKEERIKKQIEEERKQASQFKAHPLPAAVKKNMRKAMVNGGSSTTSSENKENYVKFEARPPKVLFKDPFKPILKPVQMVKPIPFDLTTEKRAAERERFDKLIKEKEKEQERLRQQKEEEQKVLEDKANAELRAKLIHHPKPAPDPTPFIPEKSVALLTVPETPKFVRRLNQH